MTPLKMPEPQWLGDIPGYTEAQLKQALRDVLEQAAKACEGQQWGDSNSKSTYISAFNEGCVSCETVIRKLK